jgi:cytochrome c-type biogenesis protein
VSLAATSGALAGAPRPLWRHPAFRNTFLGAAALAATAPLWWAALSPLLVELEFALARLLSEETIRSAAWFLLPLVGLGAGLLASLSPCILPLVPINVAAIGAAGASGRRALGLSARFVWGAALALALLGLVGDLSGFLLIEQRGPVLVVAGGVLAYFGLATLDLAPLPLYGQGLGAGRRLGPIAAGGGFALVTTPCASPLLGAVLTATAASRVPGLAVASMVSFALGYTAIVFLAGVFGGSLVTRLRQRSFEAPRAGAGALLIIAGIGFLFLGIAWF